MNKGSDVLKRLWRPHDRPAWRLDPDLGRPRGAEGRRRRSELVLRRLVG